LLFFLSPQESILIVKGVGVQLNTRFQNGSETKQVAAYEGRQAGRKDGRKERKRKDGRTEGRSESKAKETETE
jgi:hypothetical protein